MLENDSQETSDEQNPSCSSATEAKEKKDLEKDEENNLKLFDAAYRSILEELIDDVKWECCFEVHRAVKLGYIFLEDPEKRKHQIEDAEKDIFGQKLKSKVQTFQISCPMCKNKSCATKFASHLAKCIGISGRNSSRAANRKIAATNIFGCDLDENGYDSDSSFNMNKKRFKKCQTRRSPRRKSSSPGNSFPKSSETNANYQEMTFEKRKAFFEQAFVEVQTALQFPYSPHYAKCGVISKRTNKMCMNPHKCVQHTDEQRRDVRHILLREIGDQITSDAQIDIDTVDEGNDGFSFMTQTFTTCCSAGKSTSPGPGFPGEKKQPNAKTHSANLKKKKTNYDSSSSVSSPVEVSPSGSSAETI